jgi:hypothetical protein
VHGTHDDSSSLLIVRTMNITKKVLVLVLLSFFVIPQFAMAGLTGSFDSFSATGFSCANGSTGTKWTASIFNGAGMNISGDARADRVDCTGSFSATSSHSLGAGTATTSYNATNTLLVYNSNGTVLATYNTYCGAGKTKTDCQGFFGGTFPYDATYWKSVDWAEGSPAVYGCTDIEAENYDPNATIDDDSCTYAVPYVPTYDIGTTTADTINILTTTIFPFLLIVTVYLSAFFTYNFLYGRSRTTNR